MSIIKHAVISAAGMGTRLGLNQPKCLVEINNKKIIAYLLELVKDIEDIRIVVGFMEKDVIDYVKNIRSDVTFVRNPDYKTTTNSYSVYLATKDLKEPYLMVDGDLLINQPSYLDFINKVAISPRQSLIGITKAKTEEAVFVSLNSEQQIISFTREQGQLYEWSGLAYFSNIVINEQGGYIFSELEKYLPLKTQHIVCWEIDTPDDLELARKEYY